MMAEERIEPHGEQRADYHAAQISCMLATIYRKKGAGRPRIADHLLRWRTAKRAQTPEEMIALARAFCLATGGVVIDGNRDR